MEKKGNGRLALLDSLRGLTLISMILFHACWDAVYMLGADWPWYGSRAGYIWQQSICWTFILLSGLMIPLKEVLGRSQKRAIAELILFAVLFVLSKDINSGVIGTGMLHRPLPVIPKWTMALPEAWYRNLATAYLGFPPADFFSTDYFSLIPWVFLYLCGYELHVICRESGALEAPVLKKKIEPFAFMGRNSLLIYLLHQPVLYLFVILINMTR